MSSFDLLLRRGTVIDGTKSPRFVADVGIQGDKIAAVGNLDGAEAARMIDAGGKIIAPGFIDLHNHSDGWLIKHANFLPKTSQGFSTEVLMADGISYAPVDKLNWRQWFYYLRALNGLKFEDYEGWESLADYMKILSGRTAQNIATHVPYANVRALACGFGRSQPDDFQLRCIATEIQKGMEAGAVGLSTGLDYISQCFSGTDEIVAACKAMAPYGGLYVTHIRYKSGLMPALNEAVDICRRAGVKLHVSHLKGGTEQAVQEVLHWIDTYARKEVDFSFDVYPYQRGSTMVNYLLPYEVWEEGPLAAIGRMSRPELLARFRTGLEVYRLPLDRVYIAWTATHDNQQHVGKLLVDYAADVDQPIEEALYHLLVEDSLATLLVLDEGSDKLVQPLLAHDLYLMGSDGIFHPEPARLHPRVYGSAGRLLGPLVRDAGLFPLEDAVYKLSGGPARRFGLAGRGVIREGAFADFVVFDPAAVGDRATYEEPHQTCAGIEIVGVNGQIIFESGQPHHFAGERWKPASGEPGRFLRYEGAKA
jgi:N-acyl-D-amino-acid deacylase